MLGRILFVNLKKETIRQEEKVVRTRKNITDNTDKEQQEEIEFKRRIPKQYWKYYNTIFNKRTFNELPLQRTWNHTIKIISEALLRDCKAYLLSVKKQQELNNFLKEHLKTERI